MTRLVVGCMTGTSLDGLDCALVAIEGHGLALRPQVIRGHTQGLGPLGPMLRDLAEQKPATAGAIAALMRAFSLLHAEAVRGLLGTDRCDLIAVHGQTVVHAPPVSWQLFQSAPLAQALGVPVVCDLRAADLACGGQGAPITPLSDWLFLRSPSETRVVVNLGGFCNITILPAGGDTDTVRGCDVCACNQLLDAIARRCFGRPYDDGGRMALSGTAHPDVTSALTTHLGAQHAARRSLGTGDELATLVADLADRLPGPDLARSACLAIARVVVAAGGPGRYALAGGGIANAALREAFAQVCGADADATDELGLPAQWREAAAMAVLGALCQDGIAITLPQVTGVTVPAPLAGCWAFAGPSRAPALRHP